LAPKNEKKDLLNSVIYDFKDIVKAKEFNYLKDNLEILAKNINDLKNLDINFQNYFNNELINKIKIPEGLQNEFSKNFEILSKNLNLDNFDLSNNKVIEFIDYSKNNLKTTLEKSS
jgi:hypothetical protein